MGEQEGRDDLEGRYTQSDPEVPEPRGVHGQYTERESEGPQPDVLGTYIGTEREGTEPLVRSTHQRIGNYPASEPELSVPSFLPPPFPRGALCERSPL